MTDNRAAANSEMEFITPPVNLRSKVRVMSAREAKNFDPVAAAETALQRLSTNFNDWMHGETVTLMRTWADINENGLSAERRDTLFRTAHDIKGQAATLGFPLAGNVADSLCHLLESVPDVSRIPGMLIEQHVQAVRAIVAEDARDEKDKIGQALSEQLADVTAAFIGSLETAD